MTEHNRVWLGRNIQVMVDPEINLRKPVGIRLTDAAAEEMRRYLEKGSLGFILADPCMAELKDALDYVLRGSEIATRAHDRMEASKGMTPDGG